MVRLNFLLRKEATRYLLPALTLLIFTGCAKEPKEKETVIYGKIVDWETGEPIHNVIIYRTNRCDASSLQTTFITQSNPEGNYRLTLAREPKSNCTKGVIMEKEGYFDGGPTYKAGIENECNIRLAKNSYLNVHIKNAAPVDGADHIKFRLAYNGSYGEWQFFGSGATLDTSFIALVLPNHEQLLMWDVRKNNVTRSFSRKIYIPSGDTSSTLISY